MPSVSKSRSRPGISTLTGKWLIASATGILLTALLFLLFWEGRSRPTVAELGVMRDSRLITIPEAPATHIYLIIPTADGKNAALSHYTEHLAWLNSIGGKTEDTDRHSNAWTTNYAITYWLSGRPDELPELLRNLLGVLQPIDLAVSFADEERNIVLREYDYRIGDNPDAQANETMNAFLYQGNILAASVIGTQAEIGAFEYDSARAFHAATHLPENAALIVIGDVTESQISRELRGLDLPRPQNTDPMAPPPFDLAEPVEAIFYNPDPDVAPRMIWRKVVALSAPVQFDLLEAQTALLRDILDTNLPGGLAGPLRFDAAIARSFDINIWPIDERHIEISFSAEPDSNQTFATLRQGLESNLADIAAEGVVPDTYSRVLKRFTGFWPDWDDSKMTADWLAAYSLRRLMALREPLTERQLSALEDQVNLRDINYLLKELAGQGRIAITFIGKGPHR